jgi:hypothetical protein
VREPFRERTPEEKRAEQEHRRKTEAEVRARLRAERAAMAARRWPRKASDMLNPARLATRARSGSAAATERIPSNAA